MGGVGVAEAERVWREDIGDSEMKYGETVMTALCDGMAKSGQSALIQRAKALIEEHHGESRVMWMSLLSAAQQQRNHEMVRTVFAELRTRFADDTAFMASASIVVAKSYALSAHSHSERG